MSCKECALADANPLTPRYFTGCPECDARHIAHGIEHAKSMAAKKMTPGYVSALRAAFGDDWQAGHQRVKQWAVRILSARMGVAA